MGQAKTREILGDDFRYSCLNSVFTEEEISRRRSGFMNSYSKITKNYNKTTNSVWVVRNYLAVKMILSSSVMLTSVQYANNKNLRIVEPYLVYYALLSCARSVIYTSPTIDWDNGTIIEMTHSKIINVVSDIVGLYNKTKGDYLKELLTKARDYREIFSYKFPAGGIDKAAVSIEESIDECRLLSEIAQFQSELLARSYDKNVKYPFGLDRNILKIAFKYSVKNNEFIDKDDYYRLDYMIRKQDRPFSLYLTMSEGMVEDFFGAWCADNEVDESEDLYNPDKNWRIIFPVP